MKKVKFAVLVSTLLFAVAASASEPTATSTPADDALLVASSIPYMDESLIDDKIIKECLTMGTAFSKSVASAGGKYGVKIAMQDVVTPTSGKNVLVLKMVTATSEGNAFLGHHKAVTAKGELYRDGKLVKAVTKSRNSSGGFGGGFKGSCTVLERNVDTLGSDFIEWVKEVNQAESH